MNTLPESLEQLAAWKTIGRTAVGLAKQAAAAGAQCPAGQPMAWYSPRYAQLHTDLTTLPAGFGVDPWVPVKAAGDLSDVVRPTMQAMHLVPADFSKAYGGPTPIAATIAGGLLGAGLGYAGGTAAEHLAPAGTLQHNRLRKSTAILGGLLGAVPGLTLGGLGMAMKPENENSWGAWAEPNVLFGAEGGHKLATWAAEDLAEELPGPSTAAWIKAADVAGAEFVPSIEVDGFNRAVWQDPFTPIPIRGATIGLVDAANQAGGGSGWVSPGQVARVVAGAGVGLVAGGLIGRALGVLAGLSPETQKTLQQAGTWAGILQAVIPRAFGA